MLAPATDMAIAVSKSTAEFVINARQMPPERVKVVYLGVPLEEFSRNRTVQEIARSAPRARRAGAASSSPASVTRLHDSKGNSYLVEAARRRAARAAEGAVLSVRRGAAAAGAGGAGAGARAWAIGSSSAASRATSRARCRRSTSACSRRCGKARRSRCSRTLAMGKPIVATDADGLLDVLTQRTRRADRAEARRRRAGAGDRAPDGFAGGSRAAVGARAGDRPAVRHRRVRAEDGAALRAAARRVAQDEAARACCRRTCRF